MRAKGFLHKLLSSVMHKKRLTSLILLVSTLLTAKKLSVTGLGREINLPIKENSGIRRADRFIGSNKLKTELKDIYGAHAKNLIGAMKQPKIIVDWTHVPNTNFHALRAALAGQGRALTLYEEVHPEKRLGSVKVERNFLRSLKQLIPDNCKPIIITDAGYRNPWFKAVVALGWDFLGRIRGMHTYHDGDKWLKCNDLYAKANTTVKYIGKVLLCKENSVLSHLVLLKEKPKNEKWRKKYKKYCGKKAAGEYRKGAKTPWLLASSLPGNSPVKAKRIIKLYKLRMQIEEGFRDLKSEKFGFGLRNAHSRKTDRVQILLMIAMFAALIAWLVGLVLENYQLHYQFQTNSIKSRRVLSLFYLGCRAIKKSIKIPKNAIEGALLTMQRIAA